MTKINSKSIVSYVITSILLYLPVIIFWRFVFFHTEPDGARFVLAFKLFSIVALAHVFIMMNLKSSVDRFALATDIWLIVCGLLSWLGLWDTLRFFGENLGVTGYWIVVLVVSLTATYGFPGGLIAAGQATPEAVRRYSLIILLLIFLVLMISYGFRDETFWAAILPTIFLSSLSKYFCSQYLERTS